MRNCFCSNLKERRKYFEDQFHCIENNVVHGIVSSFVLKLVVLIKALFIFVVL